MRKLIQKSLAFGLQLKGIDEAISHFEQCTRGGWVGGVLCTADGTNPDADKSMGPFCRWTGTLQHARTCGPHARLINGIFEAIKVSCKHMKANQLVSGLYYEGFNTDLEVEGVGVEGFKESRRFKARTVTYADWPKREWW